VHSLGSGLALSHGSSFSAIEGSLESAMKWINRAKSIRLV
jgi:hypothetical protein